MAPAPPLPEHRLPPAVVAVVAADRVADRVRLADAAAAAANAVVADGADDPGSWAGRVDAAVRAGRQVVLSADSAADDAWRRFCALRADRIGVVVDATAAPAAIEGVDAAADAVLVGATTAEEVAGWRQALRSRVHHHVPTRAAEAATARAARRLTGRSVGIVLSGGGARAFAQLGVLAALADAGIAVDRYGGTGVGAVIGALAARGMHVDDIIERCRAELVDFRPIHEGAKPGDADRRRSKLKESFGRLVGEDRIELLPCDFHCVSTDLVGSAAVVHRSGRLADVLLAANAIPGLVAPVCAGRLVLVDGGVLRDLPVAPMLERGEGPVVAVDAGVDGGWADALADDYRYVDLPVAELLARTMSIGSREATLAAAALADAVVTPDLVGVGPLQYQRIDELVGRGRTATTAFLDTGWVIDLSG